MENYKSWDDDKLKSEYDIIVKHVNDVLSDIKKYPEDKFLKEQLKISREYKKKLQIELELRGLDV